MRFESGYAIKDTEVKNGQNFINLFRRGLYNMSTNLIYCYSGTGNCLDMAKNIAKELGDTDIVMMRSFPAVT